MRLSSRACIWVIALSLLVIGAPLVQASDLWLSESTISLSDTSIVHNQTVRIYATIHNSSDRDQLGSVRFLNLTTGEQIGTDQAVSALSENTDTVFVDWTPTAGTYEVNVTIYPWDDTNDNTDNNSTSFTKTIDYDYDGDGVGNSQDPDDDNDGTPDEEDDFPLDDTETTDTDGDGVGDNSDDDDDNDGTNDEEDDLPLDPTETTDTDGDGQGNNADNDDDNDGLTDDEEQGIFLSSTEGETGDTNTNSNTTTTDPQNPDTDGDGYNDGQDSFPVDETEWVDSDSDGVGNNADPNDDNDDLLDTQDEYPENHGPVIEYEEYQATDPDTGDQIIVLSAANSYDPDGDSSKMIFRWFTKDGRLLGEEAEYRTTISSDMLLPSVLQVFDENGEFRELVLNLTQNKLARVLGLTIGFILLFALAILILMKYTSSASDKKQSTKKSSKSRSKS
jgi:hypothetical protein